MSENNENRRKLRHTFSRIIPNLQLGEDIIVFFCDSIPELSLYNLEDGFLFCTRINATEIVSSLMHLKVQSIPWNNVERKNMEKIQKSFKHIYKEQTHAKQIDENTAKKMRSEMNRIFADKYT
jgi:hypothetical protein